MLPNLVERLFLAGLCLWQQHLASQLTGRRWRKPSLSLDRVWHWGRSRSQPSASIRL